MKLVDVNLLIYATNRSAPHHEPARAWLTALMRSDETVALPWAVLVAFVRLTTNPRVLVDPLDAPAAVGIVASWRSRPNVTVPEPTDRHLPLLQRLLVATGVGANLVADAHLAALAIEHGATLCSADVDFSRFPTLNWMNPLAA
jgi:hypothetical protein